MKNNSVQYYLKRLNQVPPQVKEILSKIRDLDKQVLNKQILLQNKREKFLEKLQQYQENKHSSVSKDREEYRENKSTIKNKKKGRIGGSDNNSFLHQGNEIEQGGLRNDRIKQRNPPKPSQELQKSFKIITNLQNKLMSLTAQKIELSQKLYNCVDEPTQQIERNISALMSNQDENGLSQHRRKGIGKDKDKQQHQDQGDRDRYKYRKNRKDKGEEFVDSEPRYCYCGRPSFGLMVKCGNQNCISQWFHSDCIEQRSKNLQDQWFCRDCRSHARTRNY